MVYLKGLIIIKLAQFLVSNIKAESEWVSLNYVSILLTARTLFSENKSLCSENKISRTYPQ